MGRLGGWRVFMGEKFMNLRNNWEYRFKIRGIWLISTIPNSKSSKNRDSNTYKLSSSTTTEK